MFLGLRASRSLAPRALAAPRRAAPALRARSLAVTMSSEASAGAKMQGEQLRGMLALIVLGVCVKLTYDLVLTPSELFTITEIARY